MFSAFTKKWWRPLLIFLLLFTAYSYFDYPDGGWNVNSRLGLTRAIVEKGRLTIDNYHNAPYMFTGDKAFIPQAGGVIDKVFNIMLFAKDANWEKDQFAGMQLRPKGSNGPAFTIRSNEKNIIIIYPDIIKYEQKGLSKYAEPGDTFDIGHFYSDKAIGTSLLGAIVYIPIRLVDKIIIPYMNFHPLTIGYFVKVGSVALPSALFAAFLFIWITGHGVDKRWAAAVILFTGLGTMSASYSTIFYGHQLGAITAFGAFMLAERLTSDRNKAPNRLLSFLLGLMAGFCLITEFTTALLIVPICIFYLVRLPWKSENKTGPVMAVLLPFIGGLIPLAIMMAYNQVCFGSPFTLAYQHMADQVFAEGMGQGLMGITSPNRHVLWYITFDPFRGLFWASPWLLLGFIGLYRLWKSGRYWWFGLSIWGTLSFLFLSSSYYMWWGGATYGPRHMIPAMYFMALPAFFIKPRYLKLILIVLGIVSVAHITLLTWANPQGACFGIDFFDGLKAGWNGANIPLGSEVMSGKVTQNYAYGVYCAENGIPARLSPVINWVPTYMKSPDQIINWGRYTGLQGIYTLIPLALLMIIVAVSLTYPFHGEKEKKTEAKEKKPEETEEKTVEPVEAEESSQIKTEIVDKKTEYGKLEGFVRKRWREILIFMILFSCYIYSDVTFPGWNINSRLGLTLGMVEEGRFNIDSFHNARLTETQDKAYYKGHYYSDKSIGTALLGAVVYAPVYFLTGGGPEVPEGYQIRDKSIERKLSVKFVGYLVKVGAIAFPSALFAAFLFVWITGHGVSQRWAAGIILLYGLGTLAHPYSTMFYGHHLAAVTAFGAFMLAERLTADKKKKTNKKLMFLLGFLAGYSLITEYTTALLILPIVIYYIARLPWGDKNYKELFKSILLPFIAGCIPLGIMFWYNTVCFGGPLESGYDHLSDPFFHEGHSSGFKGLILPHPDIVKYLTFHPFRGMFWLSPWLLFGFFGFHTLWKMKRYSWLALGIWGFVSLMFVNMSFYAWWAGACMGPRYAVPGLMFGVLPAFFVRGKVLRSLIIIFGIISVAHVLFLTWAEPQCRAPENAYFIGMRAGWEGEELPSWELVQSGKMNKFYYLGIKDAKDGIPRQLYPLINSGLRKIREPDDLDNWGTSIGLKGLYSLIPLLLIIIAGSFLLLFPFKRDKCG